ncbi:MAG: helix-turn-helix transcriptional regulator [Spirochaetes bacterium]|nr:helix-turn-helix transcriptional regulator [Spirochaetota bacterium]
MPPNLKQIAAGLDANLIVARPVPGANGYYAVGEGSVSRQAPTAHHRLFAVHAGCVEAFAQNRRCRVVPGGFIWVSAGYPVEIRLLKGTRVSALDFTLEKRGRPVILEMPHAWFGYGGEAFALLAMAAREPWGKVDGESRRRLKAWLLLILASMERWIHRRPKAAFTEGQQMAIADLIAQRIHERLTVAQIAARLSLSPDYCSRLFTSTYGKSARRTLLEERMKAIARELALGGEGVGRVAERFGYHSVRSFSRLFKQVLGVSPGGLRRAR